MVKALGKQWQKNFFEALLKFGHNSMWEGFCNPDAIVDPYNKELQIFNLDYLMILLNLAQFQNLKIVILKKNF